jgi:hypothetical protein
MRVISIFTLAVFLLICLSLFAAESPRMSNPTPILIELFTSEGCSSCPPADTLLKQFDMQPVTGTQLIVLSEHVDYWNQIGWKDPYSSRFFSDRQSMYAQRMGSDSVYTPQMIVDGTREFVGSDGHEAQQAIAKARTAEKLPITLSNLALTTPGALHGRIEIDALPESLHVHSADMFIVVALNHGESQVLRGENEGRRLQHVAVVQSITKIGTVGKTTKFAQDASVKLAENIDPANLRIIVFAQDPSSGRVLGATLQQLKP